MNSNNQLVWFRSDLRTIDNPALFCASETNEAVQAVFFVCISQWRQHDYGDAKIDFILRNVKSLVVKLSELNINLTVINVNTFAEIPNKLLSVCQQNDIAKVWVNREYEYNEVVRDENCQQLLSSHSIEFESFDEQCIVPPNLVQTKDGEMYKVFTPFYNQWQKYLFNYPLELLPTPDKITNKANSQISLQQTYNQLVLNEKTESFEYFERLENAFPSGEEDAQKRLLDFYNTHLGSYKTLRDSPSANATSQLSPYLAVGAVSAKQCYLLAQDYINKHHAADEAQCWISELCCRDFYRHIIVNKPEIVKHHAYNKVVDTHIPWSYNQQHFQKWCDGNTGIPIIDAAMRCLNQTGFMHNRLRMVVAMFLTKNLLIDWRWGERYFMNKLIDADFASNNGGWQWSASVGTDAAPYFRVMNPFSQAKTHDKDCVFIKKWCPELTKLDAAVIHNSEKLKKFNRQVNYVDMMVDVKQSRKDAIEVFKTNKPK